jgi:hypothetical protein
MIRKLVFLLEEQSMKAFLDEFLVHLLPETISWQCIPHQGKSDLEQSIPRKLRGWCEPNVGFVIIRDQDSGDCRVIKRNLTRLCDAGMRPHAQVRIACHELESWYLGDLDSVGEAFRKPHLGRLQNKAKYRNPDQISTPSREIRKILPEYQKISGSRAIGRSFRVEPNHSHSFNVFVTGIRRIVGM